MGKKRTIVYVLFLISGFANATGLKINDVYNYKYNENEVSKIIYNNLNLLLYKCKQKPLKGELFKNIITTMPKEDIKEEICNSLLTEKINFECETPYYIDSNQRKPMGLQADKFISEKNGTTKVDALMYCYLNKKSKQLNYKITTYFPYMIDKEPLDKKEIIILDNKKIEVQDVKLLSKNKYIKNVNIKMLIN